ncbi:hypothetical protein A2U01_0061751, partial [Trifolium medium]|nr:hypothetical protein [Trifolium medium]
ELGPFDSINGYDDDDTVRTRAQDQVGYKYSTPSENPIFLFHFSLSSTLSSSAPLSSLPSPFIKNTVGVHPLQKSAAMSHRTGPIPAEEPPHRPPPPLPENP